MFFDTHNHSQFSFDGSGTTVGKSAVAAAEKGLGGICFTDHCDFYVPQMKERFEPIVSEVFDIDAQQAEIDRVNGLIAEGGLGKSVPRKFRIFKGMELGLGEKNHEQTRECLSSHKFDQIIASVHYIEDTDPYFGPYYKGKNWKEAYGRYLEVLLREMRWLGDFDIMGHFDYVARYAPYPKESVLYRDFPGLFDEIFKYLIENGKGLEFYSFAPMECSTLNYLASDLDDGWDKNAHQSHSGDLTPRDFSVVKLAARQRGLACVNSWGAIPLEQYRMPYQDYSFTYVIRPL